MDKIISHIRRRSFYYNDYAEVEQIVTVLILFLIGIVILTILPMILPTPSTMTSLSHTINNGVIIGFVILAIGLLGSFGLFKINTIFSIFLKLIWMLGNTEIKTRIQRIIKVKQWVWKRKEKY